MRTVARCEHVWQARQLLEFHGGGTAVAELGAAALVYRIVQEDGLYVVKGYTEQELNNLGGTDL